MTEMNSDQLPCLPVPFNRTARCSLLSGIFNQSTNELGWRAESKTGPVPQTNAFNAVAHDFLRIHTFRKTDTCQRPVIGSNRRCCQCLLCCCHFTTRVASHNCNLPVCTTQQLVQLAVCFAELLFCLCTTCACRVGEVVSMDNHAQLLARTAGSLGNFPMDVSSV